MRRHLLDFIEKMAREEDRDAGFVGQAADCTPHLGDTLGVEPVHRLVKQQQPRAADQRTGEPQPLAHAQRVMADPPGRNVAKADQRQHPVDLARAGL